MNPMWKILILVRNMPRKKIKNLKNSVFVYCIYRYKKTIENISMAMIYEIFQPMILDKTPIPKVRFP